jgi:hypothetical protein
MGATIMAISATRKIMSACVESRRHIEGLLFPGERLKSAFPRIASLINVTPRRVRQLWAGDVKSPTADELDALRSVATRRAERALTEENLNHAATLERQASRLATIDPDFHRAEIARLRQLAQRARNLASGKG